MEILKKNLPESKMPADWGSQILPVNSPEQTFTIVQEYDGGRLPLYHFDVYRIGDVSEMDEVGYEDYFYGGGSRSSSGPD